jgi:dipeptidase E
MKLLLTSAGFTNQSIINALHELVQIPFNELKLVFVTTAANAMPGDKDWLVDDIKRTFDLGFKEMDILDFAGVPRDIWEPRLTNADILMFGGGNTFHLMHSIETTGLKPILSELVKTKVYVGISAGSMVATSNLALSQAGRLYSEEVGEVKSDIGMGFVHFHIRPHLNSEYFTKVRIKNLEEQIKELSEPIYALDDNSALKITNNKIEVISEGVWKKIEK